MLKTILTGSAIITFTVTLLILVTKIQNYKQTKITSLTNNSTATTEYGNIKNTKDNCHIILLGDSRIKNWGVPSFGKNITVTNLGIAGETTYQNMQRLNKIIALKPDLLILQIGINDIVAISLLPNDLRSKAQTESMANLRKIITTLSAGKINTLLLTIIPPLSPNILKKIIWGENIEKMTKDFNKELYADTPENITIFNMKAVFLDSKTHTWKKRFSKNALHWTDDAYQTLTTTIKSQLINQPALLKGKNVTP